MATSTKVDSRARMRIGQYLVNPEKVLLPTLHVTFGKEYFKTMKKCSEAYVAKIKEGILVGPPNYG
jgi:hypothetical protein